MITKLSQLKAAWQAGDRAGALRIASKFGDLGAHADPIRRGWDASQRPDFYRQIKKDPAALIDAAYAALAARYGLEA